MFSIIFLRIVRGAFKSVVCCWEKNQVVWEWKFDEGDIMEWNQCWMGTVLWLLLESFWEAYICFFVYEVQKRGLYHKIFSKKFRVVLEVLKVCFTAYCLVDSKVFSIFAKISPWKFFWKIFGGKEKSIYLCNRKRETNALHDEASRWLGSEMKKEFFERFT